MIRRPKLLAGKYEAVESYAKGGMATVWRGFTHGEAGFRRKVAIKRILQKHIEDQRFAAMFVQEAHMVAELNHPNIAQVHDFGRDEWGNYFIIMEWVEGLALSAYLDSYVLAELRTPWHLFTAICIEVLRALTAAHEHVDDLGRPAPIIHRDVNPKNVLVSEYGAVKLTDFGLARSMEFQGSTEPGIVKGKVAYTAPELIEGSSKADAVSDIYSVGVVLWESAAGRPLYGRARTHVDVALRALEGNPSRLDSIRDDLPGELVDIVQRALARNPEARFRSAREVVEALSSVLRHHPEPADENAIARDIKEARKRLDRMASSD